MSSSSSIPILPPLPVSTTLSHRAPYSVLLTPRLVFAADAVLFIDASQANVNIEFKYTVTPRDFHTPPSKVMSFACIDSAHATRVVTEIHQRMLGVGNLSEPIVTAQELAILTDRSRALREMRTAPRSVAMPSEEENGNGDDEQGGEEEGEEEEEEAH